MMIENPKTEKFDILERYFGFKHFRAGQEEIIDSILSGRLYPNRKNRRPLAAKV